MYVFCCKLHLKLQKPHYVDSQQHLENHTAPKAASDLVKKENVGSIVLSLFLPLFMQGLKQDIKFKSREQSNFLFNFDMWKNFHAGIMERLILAFLTK